MRFANRFGNASSFIICSHGIATVHACADASVFNETLRGCTDAIAAGPAVAAASAAMAESQSVLDGICLGVDDGLYARKNTTGSYIVSVAWQVNGADQGAAIHLNIRQQQFVVQDAN